MTSTPPKNLSSIAQSLYDLGYARIKLPLTANIQLSQLFNLASQYFKLDENSKKLASDDSLGIGWTTVKNVKEMLQIRLGDDMKFPNDCPKQLEEESKKAFKELDQLCRQYLKDTLEKSLPDVYERIESMLDPPIDELQKDGKYLSSSVLVFCRYFNHEDGKKLPCHSHTDFGLFTFCFENEPGLQVYKPGKTSNWLFCNEKKDGTEHGVLMMGEQMSNLSKGVFRSTIHRVYNTGKERISLFFKLRLRPAAVGPMSEADYKLIEKQSHVPLKVIKQKSKKTSNALKEISKLPMEIYFSIFFFLPLQEICKLRLVCEDWRELVDHNSFWRFMAIARWGIIAVNIPSWKELYKERHLNEIRQTKSSSTLHVELNPRLKKDTHVKLVVVGDTSVGKTSLLLTYANKEFPEEYIPTVFDEYTATITIDGVRMTLALWDTAGQQEYDQLRPLCYPQTSIFVILFSVVDRDSFNNVTKKWLPELKSHCPNVPFLLAGTKIDLRADEKLVKAIEKKGKPMVTYKEGLKLSKKIEAFGYFEVSAKNCRGVDDLIIFASRISAGGISTHTKTRRDKNCVVQ